MSRPKKKPEDILHVQLTSLVTNEEKRQIEEFVKIKDITISRALRYGIKEYMENHK